MSRTLSPAAVASLTAETTAEVWLVLLEIDHPDLAAPILVVNDNVDCTSTANSSPPGTPRVYIGLPFSIELPGESDDDSGIATVAIPNVDREIVNAGRTIVGPASCTITVVLASQPNTIEVSYPGMEMSDLQWDAGSVRGRLRFESIVTEPCSLIITPERFPGLF